MKRLRKLLLLSAADRRLLVKAVLLLCAVKLGLLSLPFQTLRRFVDGLSRMTLESRKAEQNSIGDVVWAVETAGRLVPRARTCLTQALTAQVLLLRRGHPARVHIGVVKGDGEQFLAHAWVESGSEVVVGGHELDRYTPLMTLEEKA